MDKINIKKLQEKKLINKHTSNENSRRYIENRSRFLF
jgi:hypothetical protein